VKRHRLPILDLCNDTDDEISPILILGGKEMVEADEFNGEIFRLRAFEPLQHERENVFEVLLKSDPVLELIQIPRYSDIHLLWNICNNSLQQVKCIGLVNLRCKKFLENA
jgi:hypothetical protein